MNWYQGYYPLGSLFLSALVAALPVIVLLGLLGFFHVKAHWAALLGLASAVSISVLVYQMPPRLTFSSAGFGAAYGLFPIGWIVLNAIFVYDISVRTGKFEVIKHTIANLAGDRRIQALLIAFSFGAFIEGAAGFGTPVAISAAMLIGLGFRPLPAAGLALIGNTAPVAFGALGTPIFTLAGITGLPIHELSAMVGRQLPFFSLLVPFWMIWVMAGFRGMREVWPACLTTGLSYAVVQFIMSNFHGPSLVDIVGSISSMIALVVLLQFWQPRTIWRFAHDSDYTKVKNASGNEPNDLMPSSPEMFRPTKREALLAWMPWISLSVFVFIWGLPTIQKLFNGLTISYWTFHFSIFHYCQLYWIFAYDSRNA